MTVTDDLILSEEESVQALEELRKVGLVYTNAPGIDQVGSEKFPLRAVYRAPASELDRNVITCGPFPLDKDHYIRLKQDFGSDKGMWIAYLALQKLEYEKLGVTGEEYTFKVEDDALQGLFGILSHFEINKPFMGEGFVWFYPTEELKAILSKKISKKFAKGDYSWWDVAISFGEDLSLKNQEEYAERFSMVPEKISKWYRYMPYAVPNTLFFLYAKSTTGLKLIDLGTREEVIHMIKEIWDKEVNRGKSMNPDRELLIKEMLDYNNIDYPTNPEECLIFFERLKLINPNKRGGAYTLADGKDFPNPKDILKEPQGWNNRIKKYTITGSVLFSYLNAEQVLRNDTSN